MRFSAEHRFVAPPAAVAGVLADPAFYEGLTLPDLTLDEVVEHRRDPADGSAMVLVRYEFTGHLDPLARGLLGGGRLTWTQELHLDASAAGTLTFLAEANPGLLHGEVSFTITGDGDGSLRHLDGEVVVGLPGLGGMAERRIVPGVLARLDIEAEAVNSRLAGP